MLIADMNDLRAQQEDASKNSMLETESVDGKKEDATFLRLALKLVLNIIVYFMKSKGGFSYFLKELGVEKFLVGCKWHHRASFGRGKG